MQLSNVLYFDIKGHFWVTSAAFIPCLFDLLLFPFSNRRCSYARRGILFGLVWLVSVRQVTVQRL